MAYVVGFLVFAALVGIDQWTKVLALTHLAGSSPVFILGGLVDFRYVENTGAAFSMFSGKPMVLSAVTAVILVILAVLLMAHKIPGKVKQASILLILSGGVGNLIDRVFRHYVVDFIEFTFVKFAVFNFADCCVTIGAAILIISLLVDIFRDGDKEKEQKRISNGK